MYLISTKFISIHKQDAEVSLLPHCQQYHSPCAPLAKSPEVWGQQHFGFNTVKMLYGVNLKHNNCLATMPGLKLRITLFSCVLEGWDRQSMAQSPLWQEQGEVTA